MPTQVVMAEMCIITDGGGIVEEKCCVHDRSTVGSILAVNLLASLSACSAPNHYTEVWACTPRLSKYFLAISVNLFRSSEVPLLMDMFAY